LTSAVSRQESRIDKIESLYRDCIYCRSKLVFREGIISRADGVDEGSSLVRVEFLCP